MSDGAAEPREKISVYRWMERTIPFDPDRPEPQDMGTVLVKEGDAVPGEGSQFLGAVLAPLFPGAMVRHQLEIVRPKGAVKTNKILVGDDRTDPSFDRFFIAPADILAVADDPDYEALGITRIADRVEGDAPQS